MLYKVVHLPSKKLVAEVEKLSDAIQILVSLNRPGTQEYAITDMP